MALCRMSRSDFSVLTSDSRAFTLSVSSFVHAVQISKVQAAVTGASQVAGAITASTLTTICVFFPIVFVDGFTKEIFTDMALTIGYSLFASLFIALTVVPAMGSTMLEKTSEKAWFSDRNRGLLKKYMFLLDKALAHRALTLLIVVVLLFASAAALMSRGIEYMPAMTSQQISASITMPEETEDADAMRIADEIANETMQISGVNTVGIMPANSTASIMGVSGEADFSEMTMYVLLDADRISENARISAKISEIGTAKGCEMIVSGDTDMTQLMGGSAISVDVFGDNNDDLLTAVAMIEDALRGMDELQEVSDVNENSQDEVVIAVDKNKAMEKGMTVAQVYQVVQQALSDTSRPTSRHFQTDGYCGDPRRQDACLYRAPRPGARHERNGVFRDGGESDDPAGESGENDRCARSAGRHPSRV